MAEQDFQRALHIFVKQLHFSIGPIIDPEMGFFTWNLLQKPSKAQL
jgi:hypothetical protein